MIKQGIHSVIFSQRSNKQDPCFSGDPKTTADRFRFLAIRCFFAQLLRVYTKGRNGQLAVFAQRTDFAQDFLRGACHQIRKGQRLAVGALAQPFAQQAAYSSAIKALADVVSALHGGDQRQVVRKGVFQPKPAHGTECKQVDHIRIKIIDELF